jgi:hypothetical protein
MNHGIVKLAPSVFKNATVLEFAETARPVLAAGMKLGAGE